MNGSFKSLRRRDFLKLASLTGLALAIPVVKITSSAIENKTRIQDSTSALGTVVSIKIDDPLSSEQAEVVMNDSFQEIRRLESLLSRFVYTSSVSILNRDSYIDHPSADVTKVLRSALSYSELTDGAFDVTVLPALNLFESQNGSIKVPSDAQFDTAKALIDFERLNVSDSQVSLAQPGMAVTLDCIGKGWVLDRIASRLKARGVRSALIQGGGSFRAVGSKADGSPWVIGVLNPVNLDSIEATVRLKDGGMTTSGDYERFFTEDKQYYHIIDPSTGRSPLYSHSVTVTAPIAEQADSLGVASMVKSPSGALSMIEGTKDCECMIFTRENGTVRSSGFGSSL